MTTGRKTTSPFLARHARDGAGVKLKAYATLDGDDGVREAAHDALNVYCDTLGHAEYLDATEQIDQLRGQIRELSAAGDEIHLPDGSVITVEAVSWSDLATDVDVELRWDPPTAEGDWLHDAQRDELLGVLAAWNAEHEVGAQRWGGACVVRLLRPCGCGVGCADCEAGHVIVSARPFATMEAASAWVDSSVLGGFTEAQLSATALADAERWIRNLPASGSAFYVDHHAVIVVEPCVGDVEHEIEARTSS